jgi:hypothetical protein
MHIHVPGDVVKDFFVGCASLDDGEYILFMTWEHGHLASLPSLAVLDMDEKRSITARVHIAHPQIAQFCPAQPAGLGEADVRLPMGGLEVPIMANRAA